LQKYKEEAKQKAISIEKEKQKSKAPAGTKLMPESERLETLADLKKNRE